MTARAALVAGLLLFVATSCSLGDEDAQLFCDEGTSVLLAAQSVPTAQHIPCIDSMPAGWTLSSTIHRSGGVQVDFDVSRAPIDELDIEFTETCNAFGDGVDAATIPFDPPPGSSIVVNDRLDDDEVDLSIAIQSDGGCTELFVDLEVNEAISPEDFPTIKWVPRSAIAEGIRSDTADRLRLDP